MYARTCAVYVCMHACMCACNVCMRRMYVGSSRMYAYMYVCMHVYMHSMHACIVCMHAGMYLCNESLYAFRYAMCVHVMRACMYVLHVM